MAGEERGQQGGLEADADSATSSAVSRLTGGAGAWGIPPWAWGHGDEGFSCAHISLCRWRVLEQGVKL